MEVCLHPFALGDDIKERIEKELLDSGLLTEPVNVGKYEFLRMPYRENGEF